MIVEKNVYQFLLQLQKNNNREWFEKNKIEYQYAKKNFESFLNLVIAEVLKFDKTMPLLAPKDCMFRINRDVRFSKNKDPYKTNFGGVIAKGGRKGAYAGYYLHIEPGNCFIGGGVYMPQPQNLEAIRREIYYHTAEFKKLISAKTFKAYFKNIAGDKLVNIPKGFPKDFPDADLLKFKDYTMICLVNDKDILKPDFFPFVINVFKSMKDVNAFLNRAIDMTIVQE